MCRFCLLNIITTDLDRNIGIKDPFGLHVSVTTLFIFLHKKCWGRGYILFLFKNNLREMTYSRCSILCYDIVLIIKFKFLMSTSDKVVVKKERETILKFQNSKNIYF